VQEVTISAGCMLLSLGAEGNPQARAGIKSRARGHTTEPGVRVVGCQAMVLLQ
jgi:hypothetical protein